MENEQVAVLIPDHNYANTLGSFETIRLSPHITALMSLGFESNTYTVSEVPWKIKIEEKSKFLDPVLYFKVECNSTCESSLWSCTATVDLTVVHRDPEKNKTQRVAQEFNLMDSSFEIEKFMSWNDVYNGGYITEKGTLNVVVSLSISKTVGFQPVKPKDFSGPDEFSDSILNVGGRQLHVNKAYLSMYSPVFKSLFYSEFMEKNQKEITIQEVKCDDFVTLLNTVYPDHLKVKASSVVSLLELADRFDVSFVTIMCEKYLINNKTFCLMDKMIFADKYHLSSLQDRCIRQLRTMADVKELKKHPKYKELTDNTRKALIEKMFKLFP